jgi:hypothetical protein
LIDQLSGAGEVDGHDCGSGEANIFILTDNPTETFRRVKTILKEGELWERLRVAYREVAGDDYTVLWPKHLTTFKVI